MYFDEASIALELVIVIVKFVDSWGTTKKTHASGDPTSCNCKPATQESQLSRYGSSFHVS